MTLRFDEALTGIRRVLTEHAEVLAAASQVVVRRDLFGRLHLAFERRVVLPTALRDELASVAGAFFVRARAPVTSARNVPRSLATAPIRAPARPTQLQGHESGSATVQAVERLREETLSQAKVEVFVVVLGLLLGLHTVVWPMGRDQGCEGAAAMMLVNGQWPYRDMWTHSLPGGFLSFALGFAVFGVGPLAVRLVDLAFIVGTAWGIARVWGGAVRPRVGLFAGVFFLLAYDGHVDFWHSAQRDGLLMLPATWAVVAAGHRSVRGAAAAGLLVGLAALYKPGGAAMLLPVMLRLGSLRHAAMAAGTSTVMPLAVLGTLWATGSWEGFWEGVVDFNAGYAANYASHGGRRVGAAIQAIVLLPLTDRPELAAAFLGLLAPLRVPAWAGAWVLAAASSVLAQAALYPYHFLPLLAPLAGLTAWALCELPLGLRHARHWARGALVVQGLACVPAVLHLVRQGLTSVAIATETLPEGDYNQRFAGAREYEVIAQHVADHSDPSERLYIWGNDAQLFVLARRLPAVRHVLNLPVVAPWGLGEAGRAQLVEELAASPPRFVVVRARDPLPWMVGTHRDSAALLQEYPAMMNFLRQNYRRVASTELLLLLERMSGVTPPAASP